MANVNLVDYLTDAVVDKILALILHQGHITKKDICQIINSQTGDNMSLEGDEKKVYTAEDFGLEVKHF